MYAVRPIRLAALLALVLGIASLVIVHPLARGHDHDGAAKTEVGPFAAMPDKPSAAYLDSTPPLWNGLGALTYKVTTASEMAQRYFDQGLRLTYAFNHAEARRAFRAAQRLDPGCALCYWGEALVLGPNINMPLEAAAVAPALAALAQAKELSVRASEKERALIEALAARYAADPKADRKTLDIAYAEAMGRLTGRFPDDQEIAVLHAESLMDISPWDYWDAGGSRAKGRTAEIVGALEQVLAHNPQHPGAIHYYIHMVEASDQPERALPYAERLPALMPGAGHLVHMPSHIYYRVGRYLDALAANRAAVAVDETYLAESKAVGIYPQGYYPHNIHFLLVSAQMAGDGKSAVTAAEKLAPTVSSDFARTVPWAQPIKAAPLFAYAQFGAPRAVLTLPDPGNDLPYVKAMWHYARGVAYAARNDFGAAQRQAEAIATLQSKADFEELTAAGIPAKDLLELARRVVLARIAQARGNLNAAGQHFTVAAKLQDGLPYMEPPFWYYPVRQSLGGVLLLTGEMGRAEAAFRASLARAPNNGWALHGLRQLYKKKGDKAALTEVERQLKKTWAGDRQTLDLSRRSHFTRL